MLFVLGAVLMAGAVASSLLVGYRSRPVYAPVDDEQVSLDRYRESLEPLRRLVLLALPAGLALFAGSALAQRWQTVLLFLNREPFGERDPQFGLDIGFFVFTLPLLRLTTGFLTAVLVLALIAAVATHYLYGGIRLQGRGARTTSTARRHIALLAGALLLVQAGTYWLDRYSLLTVDGDLVTGATYTGVNAVLPAKTILAMIAVTVALLFLVPVVRGTWRLPVYGVALMVVAAIVIGAVYPALIQFATVRPSEQTKESPYLQRSIEATRAAYGLDAVEVESYSPETVGQSQGLADDVETTASIRLLDPAVVAPHVPPAAAGQGVLQLPGVARRRPLHDRRRGARHRHRRARARSRRSEGQPAQLGQRPHRLHPRLRRGGRVRQPACGRRRSRLLPGGHPVPRRARRLRGAHLLRREVDPVLDRGLAGRHVRRASWTSRRTRARAPVRPTPRSRATAAPWSAHR